MSEPNRLVEYFLVVGVANGGQQKQQQDSATASTPPSTSSRSAVAEGENGKVVEAKCWLSEGGRGRKVEREREWERRRERERSEEKWWVRSTWLV